MRILKLDLFQNHSINRLAPVSNGGLTLGGLDILGI